jgi:hypothetical protein
MISLPKRVIIDLSRGLADLRDGLPQLDHAGREELVRQCFDFFFNSEGVNPFNPNAIPFPVTSMVPGMCGRVVTDAELTEVGAHFNDLYRSIAEQLTVVGMDRHHTYFGTLPYVLERIHSDHRVILRLVFDPGKL